MKRSIAVLAVSSAALIMPLPSLADLAGDPHIQVSALSLGGGLIQYTIDMHNPFGGAVAVTMAATGNINQIDTDEVSFDPDGPGPLPPIILLPAGPVDLFSQTALADSTASYLAGGGSASDSWWDNTDLSTLNPPFGGAMGGEVGSMAYSFSAGSIAGSDIANTRVGQIVIFDAATAGLPLGPQPVVESGFAQWSFVDLPPVPSGVFPSSVAAAGFTFDINGSFAVELTIPPSLSVDLDIKPGSDPNSLNLKSHGVLPAAILTTDEFDALQVDLASIVFGDPVLLDGGAIGVSPLRSGEEDVNGDGLIDLTLKFSIPDLIDNGALGGLSIEAILIGLTLDGTPFEASDSVRIVPPGDANNDFTVDAGDYTVWANEFGGKSDPRFDSDFNDDGSIDAADYTIWANNVGESMSAPAGPTAAAAGPTAAAVPEPSTFALAGFGLIGLLAYGWRRRRRA